MDDNNDMDTVLLGFIGDSVELLSFPYTGGCIHSEHSSQRNPPHSSFGRWAETQGEHASKWEITPEVPGPGFRTTWQII